MTTHTSFTSTAVRRFTDGFWETEAFRLDKPCQPDTVTRLQALIDAGCKVVVTVISNNDSQSVPITLVRIKPTKDSLSQVVYFDCFCRLRRASGIIDLTTQEIVLGYEGVPI
jgi:hypothetical protein